MHDPVRALFEEIRLLHRQAGEPSSRTIARGLGRGVLSHSTVNAVLRGSRVPHWGPLELVVRALGGDLERFKVLWLDARGAEDAASGTPRVASPSSLVGRRHELRLVQDWIADLAAGRGRAVLVEGEPGVGKSAFLRVAGSEAVAAGCQVFWTACDELSQAFPLLPLLQALDSPRAAGARGRGPVADVFRAESAPGNHVDLVAAATERLLALVDELCTTSSVLLVVDDLQWADAATVRCLGRLVHTARRLPLLVACITRTVPRRGDLRALRRTVDPAGRLSLGGLTEAEVDEFVANVVGGEPSPRLLKLAAEAGGNPLYLTELVNALVRGGTTTDAEGRIDSVLDSPPRSLSAAIANRLEFLPDPVRAVLRTAALQGVGFSVSELAVVSGRPLGALVPLLDEALVAGVLRADGPELAFQHPLIRAALYEEVPAGVRAAWHRDAARRLAEADVPADRVAHQLLPSLDPEHCAIADPWIVRWLMDAGQHLVNRAPRAAISLLRVAVDGLPTGADGRDQLIAMLADALYRAGAAPESVRVASAAIPLVTDTDLLVSLHWTLTQSRAASGRYEDSLAVLERALDAPAVQPHHRARLLVLIARTHALLGRVEAAGQVAAAALAAAVAAGDRWAMCWALAIQTVVLGMEGHSGAALPQFDRALAMAGADPALADLRLLLGINRAATLSNLGRCDDAVRAAEQVRHLAENAGNVVRRLQAQSVLAEVLFQVGRWDDALVEVEDGDEALLEPGAQCTCLSLASLIGLHRGDTAATAHLAAADRYARRLGGRSNDLHTLAHSLVRERAGAPDAALGLLLATLSEAEEEEVALGVLPDAARLAVAVDDSVSGRFVVGRADLLARGSEGPRARAVLTHCRGLVDNDASLLLEAARAYQTSGHLLQRAQALEAAGGAAADAGSLADARAHFTDALFLYSVLHAAWDITRTHSRIRAYGISLNPPGQG
jgi:tetratricopeptide (TPR) repeat protein